jgi:hypothetical protein
MNRPPEKTLPYRCIKKLQKGGWVRWETFTAVPLNV